jgi:hypothetical protein
MPEPNTNEMTDTKDPTDPSLVSNPMPAVTSIATKVKVGLLIALAVAHVGITFWYAAPGPLSVDEAIYHWMAKSFSDSGRLDVWNGYDEFPSPELHHRYIRARGDKLFPQYPSLFAVLAFPFYRAFGFFGLFAMNSLAFAGVTALCFLTAKRLFRDIDLALNACLILVLATFAWEYSQAAWPHAVGLLFVMGAFLLSIEAYGSPDRRRAMLLAAASGAVATLGLGMRLDGILVFPALVLPFLFARPWRPIEAVMVGLGTIPALVPLIVINYIKFGVFDPFSYGEGPGVQVISPWPVIAAAAAVLAAWICTRPAFTHKLGMPFKVAGAAAAGAVLLALALFTPAGSLIYRTVLDAYIGVVDIRAFPMDVVVAVRSAGGGVLYVGAHKKALLQSLPYLVLCTIPLLRIVRQDQDWPTLVVLFLTPLTVIGFYSYSLPFHDTGGLCVNTRYYLPGLPFLAILCAFALRELQETSKIPFSALWVPLTCVAMAALFHVWTKKVATNVNDQEFPLLVLPLLMASLLLFLVVCSQMERLRWAKSCDRAAMAVAVAAMTWAGLVALAYDYPAHRFARAVHHFYGQTLLKAVPSDSILFADNKTFAAATAVIDTDRVRIAFPYEDRFKDFHRLLHFQLQSGRRSFALFHNSLWERLKAGGMLRNHQVIPAVEFHNFTLSEIVLTSGNQSR